MLEKLDQVDWESIPFADEYAPKIPDAIRELCSDKEYIWRVAIDKLYDYLFINENPIASTSYAVPFLIELLDNDDEALVAALLEMLIACIAPITPNPPPESLSKQWIDATANAVRDGIPFYINLLESRSTPKIKILAAEILSYQSDDIANILPVLLQVFNEKENTDSKSTFASFIYGISNRANSHQYDCGEQIEVLLANEEDAEIVVCLAATVIRLKQNKVSDHVINQFENALLSSEVNSRYVAALTRLSIDRSTTTLTGILEKGQHRLLIHEVVNTLLAINFTTDGTQAYFHRFGHQQDASVVYTSTDKRPIFTFTGALTNLQKKTVEAILNKEAFWHTSTNLLGCYGLPNTYQELKIILGSY